MSPEVVVVRARVPEVLLRAALRLVEAMLSRAVVAPPDADAQLVQLGVVFEPETRH
jgi:hypothetical protein